MQLTGTPEFIKQAIEIAARKDMRIEFKDAAHNTALEAEREKIRKGRDYTARNIKANEKALAEEEAGRRKLPVETLSEKQADFDEKAAPGTPAPAAPGKGKGDDDDEGGSGSGSSGAGSAPGGDHGPNADDQEEDHDRERVR